MGVNEMSCVEMEFMIQRYYDGELVVEEESILKRHLHGCPACEQDFREFGALFGDITALQVQVEHRDVLSQTLARLEEANQKRQIDIWWRGVAVAASLLIIGGTAYLNGTDSGKSVKHHVSAWWEQSKTQPLLAGEVRGQTDVQHNSSLARAALENIHAQVKFPLLELGDARLQLDSTSLRGGDENMMYQMVELEYKLVGEKPEVSDTVYFLATPDNSLKYKAKSNLGIYEFKGEFPAGKFTWAKVGEHAVTAEINDVYYQIFSPFLTTDELLQIAATLQKR